MRLGRRFVRVKVEPFPAFSTPFSPCIDNFRSDRGIALVGKSFGAVFIPWSVERSLQPFVAADELRTMSGDLRLLVGDDPVSGEPLQEVELNLQSQERVRCREAAECCSAPLAYGRDDITACRVFYEWHFRPRHDVANLHGQCEQGDGYNHRKQCRSEERQKTLKIIQTDEGVLG